MLNTLTRPVLFKPQQNILEAFASCIGVGAKCSFSFAYNCAEEVGPSKFAIFHVDSKFTADYELNVVYTNFWTTLYFQSG